MIRVVIFQLRYVCQKFRFDCHRVAKALAVEEVAELVPDFSSNFRRPPDLT